MWYSSRDELDYIALMGRKLIKLPGSNTPIYRMNGCFWLACEPNDTAFTPSARDAGTWEAWVSTAISMELAPTENKKMFIDVGANVGYYSFLAEKLNARVVSFEPNKDLMKYWDISRQANGLYHISDPYVNNVGVGAVAEKRQSYVHENHSGAMSFDAGDTPGETYDIVRLDDVITPSKDFGLVVIKVDVEGFEREVWDGAYDLREFEDNVWFVEWVPSRHGIEYNRNWLQEVLISHNLQMVNTDGVCVPVGIEEALSVEFETIVFRKRQ